MNPFGKDGALTRLGEHIPGVNNGIQALHRRAGNEEALARARRKDPIGAEGALTKVAERVPVLNNVCQELHKKAGKAEALERARERDPIGADGYLTQAAEYVPILNRVAQELHRNAGKQEALGRARERDPIGAHGYLTQLAEQVPILNDGVVELHRLAGQHVAAERARGKSLRNLMNKDGAITKVAELLPGTNLVAALIHELAGNEKEADRALDLVRNWREVGSPNGPLLKLAELVHGADVIAFALHLNSNNYPQALRAITKTSWVDISVPMEMLVSVVSVQEIEFLSVDCTTMDIRPKGAGIVGGVMDLATHFLHMDRDGHRRSREKDERRRKKGKSPHSRDGSTKEKAKTMVKDLMNEAVTCAICSQIDAIELYVQLAIVSVNDALKAARKDSLLLRLLLPEVAPVPSLEAIEALENAIPGIRGAHGPIPVPETVRPRPLPDAAAASDARPHGGTELAGAVACTCFAGYLGLGAPSGACFIGCLAGVVAAGAQLGRLASRKALPWLNAWNARAATSTRRKPLQLGEKATPAQAAPEHVEPPPLIQEGEEGLVLSALGVDLEALEPLLAQYFVKDFYRGHILGPVLTWLTPKLRAWLASLVEAEQALVPLFLEVTVPEQEIPIVEDSSGTLSLRLPEIPLCVHLDLRPSTGPPPAGAGLRDRLIRGLTVSLTDAHIRNILAAVQDQVTRWDLRRLDPRLEGFTEPVHLESGLDLQWPKPTEGRIVFSDLRTKLHLPA